MIEKYFNHFTPSLRPNESEIREYINEWSKIDWEIFSESYKLDKNLIREFKDKFTFTELTENKDFSYDLFCELISDEDAADQMNWKISYLTWRCSQQYISEEEVESIIKKELVMFFSDWDWHVIMELLELSDKFIKEEMIIRNMWQKISSMKNLKDSIIDEYSDKLNWGLISAMHKLDDRFIGKYKDKLNLDTIGKRLTNKIQIGHI